MGMSGMPSYHHALADMVVHTVVVILNGLTIKPYNKHTILYINSLC